MHSIFRFQSFITTHEITLSSPLSISVGLYFAEQEMEAKSLDENL